MSSKKRQKEEQTPDSKTKRRRRYSIQVKREIIELREKGLNQTEAIDYMSQGFSFFFFFYFLTEKVSISIEERNWTKIRLIFVHPVGLNGGTIERK